MRSRFEFVEPSALAERFQVQRVPAFTGTALHFALVGVDVECSEAEVVGGIVLNDKITVLVDMPVGTPATALERHMMEKRQLQLVAEEG